MVFVDQIEISLKLQKSFNPNFLKDVSLFLWICLSNKIASCIDDLTGLGCEASAGVHALRLRLVCPKIPSPPWRWWGTPFCCVECWCLLFTSNRARDHKKDSEIHIIRARGPKVPELWTWWSPEKCVFSPRPHLHAH